MAYDGSKTLGNYRLLQLLGQGGFADVYLGEHIYLKTSAAIKVMRVLLSSDALPPFLAEARMIASLRHPHIVIVHDFGIEHDVPFLVMGYAPYGSLRRLHPIGSSVPLETVALYVKQMSDALQYAHDQKIIHRDVKPENILLSDSQVLMLSDFGIAVALNSMPSHPVAQDKGTIGTTTYMAPELFTGDAVYASDQYSLGIAVYEWLAGSAPFNGSDMEIALQHVHIAVPSLKDKVPGLSDELERVVIRALAKKPEDRFPAISDFARAFEEAFTASQFRPATRVAYAPATLPPTDDHMPDDSPVAHSGLQALDQTTWNAPPLMRFGKPVWMELPSSLQEADVSVISQPLAPDSRRSEMVMGLNSLKLPAQTNNSSKRFFDYAPASDMETVASAPPALMPHPQHHVPFDQQFPLLQKLSSLTVVSTLKQKWTSQAAPAVKHFWLDQAVPTARYVWLDRAVPSLRHFWAAQAVPAAKKLSSLRLPAQSQQPNMPSPDLYAERRKLLAQSRTMMSTQSVLAYSPPPMQGDQKVPRRVLIAGAAGLTVVGVAVATAASLGVFSPKQALPKPTPVPTLAPVKVQPTQPPNTPTATPQNAALLAPTRPSGASWSPGQMDVFIRGSDGGLWQRHYTSQWNTWGMDVTGLVFDPVVTSWGAGRFDVFARGGDNTLQHTWYDGQWHPWESLGGALTSDPAVVSWGANRLDVFVRSTDNALWHKAFDGSWHDWESLGGVQLSSPSASTWGANRLDVFVRGTDSALWHRGYDGSWHDWESLGGSFDSDPGAVSIAANHLDVFVRGAGNVLQHISYDGNWHPWESLGGVLTSSPFAMAWESGRIDVFARTANNVLQQTWNEAGTWSSWVPLT